MAEAVLLALVPIALLIGLGQVMRRVGFLAEAFWPQAERLAYYVLLPALLLHGLATARLSGVPVGLLVATLVLACLGGIGLQATEWGVPPGIEPVLRALGQASLPLGLLCVGAALNLSSARAWLRPVFAASVVKFMVMPLAAALACAVLGLHGPAAATALLFQALPTASSSYIMARQLGGDAPLMAAIAAVQTILAGIAIPLAMAALSVPVG